jgi:anti-anti-sigma factor
VDDLVLSGELHLTNAETVGAVLAEELAHVQDAMVEIDCSELRYIDSSGLKMLVHLTESTGKKLTLVGVSKQISRTFEIAGLGEHFVMR